ncbi:hypothetical protein ACOME3_008849 [Neoechinorhynchus agilis]
MFEHEVTARYKFGQVLMKAEQTYSEWFAKVKGAAEGCNGYGNKNMKAVTYTTKQKTLSALIGSARGQLKIYFNGNLHLSNFHKFIETNCDTSGVQIINTSYNSTFLMNGLSPEIDTADKKIVREQVWMRDTILPQIGSYSQVYSQGGSKGSGRPKGRTDKGEMLLPGDGS